MRQIDPPREHRHRAVGRVHAHDLEVGAGAEDRQHVGGLHVVKVHDAHRRGRGKQKRQSQALMEHLRLALRIVIGQACEIAAAFQGIGLVGW